MRISIFLPVFLLSASLNAGVVNHDLKVRIEPAQNRLEAEDTITLPRSFARDTKPGGGASPEENIEPKGVVELVFSLHKGLLPSTATAGVELRELSFEEDKAAYGIDQSSAGAVFTRYSVRLPQGLKTFSIKYGGVIAHPLAEQAENYARSFSETPGLITGDGAFLSGAAFWYPRFDGQLYTFRIETDLPESYDSVAGGDRVSRAARGGRTLTVWKASSPQDEIVLVCGRYKEYDAEDAGLKFQVFLREPDAALAQKYLDAAVHYTAMYSELIGPYPYGKFAMVENFWETGYGFPSFTLLGSKVIRLPFILNSSYPHEILHNWWGDGVFVDYEQGNWSEGLTAYLADYLLSEYRGKGREYRVTDLQKYADYVRSAGDLPLRTFRSRTTSATEAVGYGKALMFYHMLRNSVGDEKFKAGLRDFYEKNKFRTATFEDLKYSFEAQTGPGRLDKFFRQWIDRTGAPELALKDVSVAREADGYKLNFTVAQLQDGPAYQLDVPVAMQFENIDQPHLLRLAMTKKEETFKYTSAVPPTRVEIDPEFDLFRKLSPLETSPTLSRLLGAENPLIVLPSAASSEDLEAYETFARTWTRNSAKASGPAGDRVGVSTSARSGSPEAKENALPEIIKDSELTALPTDRQVWVLGMENRFYSRLASGLEALGGRISPMRVTLNDQIFPLASSTFVIAEYNPENPNYSAGLILAGRSGKLQLLADKLPHYGKYGYLVFDSDMASLATGGWETRNSPLSAELNHGGRRPVYPRRAPLAVPPSVFPADQMKHHVMYLTSGSEGRGPGEAGHEKAGKYVEKMFRQYGLTPLFENGYAQGWSESGQTFKNLAGAIKGSGRQDEYVIISAHYDHLPSANGKVYPGANDNASGLALLLELAAYYAKQRPARTIVFAAFDGEEEGRLGSRYFVRNPPAASSAKNGFAVAPEKIDADINLDTVGRLDGGKIVFLNSGSSDKWVHILRGAGFVTGTEYEASKLDLDSSDQVSFIEAGVPGIQLLSSDNADYHKVTDTADKLDYQGMVREAEFIREIADYLAGGSDMLTRPAAPDQDSGARQNAGSVAGQGAPSATRKVATGLVPSFDWDGKGVKSDSVAPGSPLAAAGFKAGDVIIKINDVATDNLISYSLELKKYKPGDKVKLTYLSDNVEKTAEIELTAK